MNYGFTHSVMLSIDLSYKNTEPVSKYKARTHATCREKIHDFIVKKTANV